MDGHAEDQECKGILRLIDEELRGRPAQGMASPGCKGQSRQNLPGRRDDETPRSM